MRLRSDIVVSAMIRRVFAAGGFAAVEQKGMDQAGAIFLRQRFRDGLETLYGPAPQSLADDDTGERRFERRLERVEPQDIDAQMARERRFDPDLWLVELEIDQLGDLFVVVE
ncbi:DUF1491 family protein [Allorhizobium taibaishanense]|uniref:DUF1491 domain-containing protein n=1 Tax=Allorhizobium taibaishanense TaxID=887144 RepID=A0A1Q8ZZG5_9HYPH|nr:DUF1491 family protein [Allorhizobium taibaishanense]MBB4007283.1 hypothetical protein [Allorhizobium taibaishanense]OLP47725.1 hypothetical protein BJF91_04935 [Allorhizobium taibaishanense]